jgi:hypothetical protein
MCEVFEHTADLGLRITAASWDELCADAGLGCTGIAATGRSRRITTSGEPSRLSPSGTSASDASIH